MYKRIVVKLGTSVLTGGTRRLDRAHMVEIARQCAALRRQGCEVIVVTSGAIAAGRERLDHPALPPTVAAKQMLAAVGQSWLMHVWESLFEIYGLHVGQMLLTRADVADRDRFLNARDMLVRAARTRHHADHQRERRGGDGRDQGRRQRQPVGADRAAGRGGSAAAADRPARPLHRRPAHGSRRPAHPGGRHDRRDAPPHRRRERQRAGGGRDDAPSCRPRTSPAAPAPTW